MKQNGPVWGRNRQKEEKSVIRTTGKRAVLYARFSSDNQRSESIDAQLRAMRTYCRQRHLEIVDEYVDEAKSAVTDKRPAFQQMIADSAQHRFDIVLVHKLDRFARNRYDSAVYKRTLKKNGVRVFSVLENLDDTPESIMMESVLEGMSEYYSRNLGREVMKGMKETALQCKHTGGLPPLGYDVDKESRKLTVNQQEAKAVRLIFQMYTNGKKGYGEIVKVLHEKGMKTKTGNDFTRNSLYEILKNRKYTGVYIFNRAAAKGSAGKRNNHLSKDSSEMVVVEGGVPRIIDPAMFEIAQQRIEKNRHAGCRNHAKQFYLLSGKLHCQECGKAMTGNARWSGRNKRLYVTYRCPGRSWECGNKEINRDYLEQYIVRLLEREILNPNAIIQIKEDIRKKKEEATYGEEERIAVLQADIREIESEQQHIADAIAKGLISAVLTDRFTALEEEKKGKERELTSLLSPEERERSGIDPDTLLAEYLEVKSWTPELRDLIGSLIEDIEVGRFLVKVTLKNGMGIYPELNQKYLIRRQEIYSKACSAKFS